jgi:hypothetical protein
MQAIEDGRLPNPEESVESQKAYKKHRDGELYNPLIGGVKKDEGRPAGTKAKQTTKKVSPIGASEDVYSASKLKNITLQATKLESEISNKLKKQYSIDSLNEEQKNIVNSLMELIMANELVDNWKESIDEYIKNPIDKNKIPNFTRL